MSYGSYLQALLDMDSKLESRRSYAGETRYSTNAKVSIPCVTEWAAFLFRNSVAVF